MILCEHMHKRKRFQHVVWVECCFIHTKCLVLPTGQLADYGLNEYISEARVQPVVYMGRKVF